MDDGAGDWQRTGGWTLTADSAYGNAGLSWQLMTSGAAESLHWLSAVDLRNVPATQSIQLGFASWLHLVSGTAQVEVSSDGGNQWAAVGTIIPSDSWSTQAIDLSGYAGQIIQLQFVWQPDPSAGNSATTTQWRVDQVSIQVAAAPTPSATPYIGATETPTFTLTLMPTETMIDTLMPTPTDTWTDTSTNIPASTLSP